MRKKSSLSNHLRPTVLATAVSTVMAGLAMPGVTLGQEATEVVVTGSRIVRRDFDANSPIVTIDENVFEESSTIGMESVLNQLPQFVPAITQFQSVPPGGLSDSGDSSMTPTAASVSLRGLGSNRNLVMINGRRPVPVDASMAVDINSIPSAIISRVETISGGASSVYGADAVAGVVNFVLKDDYEGLNFDGQYGVTEEGDGVETMVSVLFGTATERSNVVFAIEHYERDKVWQEDRDFYTEAWADPRSSGGQQVFYTAPYVNVSGANPIDLANNPNALDMFDGNVTATTGNFYLNNDGSIYRTQAGGNYRYNGPTETTDGHVYRQVLEHTFSAGNLGENWVGAQISSPTSRQTVFGSAKYDITDNVSAFGQATFTNTSGQYRRRVGGMVGGWGGSVPHGSGLYAPSLDTATGDTVLDYVSVANGGTGRFGLDCPVTGGCTDSQVWPKSPEAQQILDARVDPNGDVPVGLATTWNENVRNGIDTKTYQLMLGLEGALEVGGRDWTWEVYLSDGESEIQNEYIGTTSTQRWRYVINQPNYGAGLFQIGNQDGGGFGAGAMECTSGFGTLGQGEIYYMESTGLQTARPSDDCLRAISANLAATSRMEQTVIEFNMQGGLLDLPAGEMAFAFGMSQRENKYRFLPPPLNTPESIFDLPAGQYPRSLTSGEVSTDEVYGELLVPLIEGVPGIQSLEMELGYRYSDNDPSDATSSYKALLNWVINDNVRVRGGYQVANRAPNIAELFRAADNTLIVGSQGDFCSTANPGNALSANPAQNPNAAQARALCEALMGSTAATEYYNNNQNPGSTVFYFPLVEGNPDLTEETADTVTVGVVANLMEGLTFTVDYWNIEIEDMIAAQNPEAVYTECFSPVTNPSFSPTTDACMQIVRSPDSGNDAGSRLNYSNEGAVDFSGFDLALNWTTEVGPGTLNINTQVTVAGDMKTRITPEAAWTDYKGTAGPSDISGLNGWSYDWRSLVTASYSLDNWSATVRWRHLPSIDPIGRGQPGNFQEPTGSYDVFNLSGRYNFSDVTDIRFGIDNVFNVDPEKTWVTGGTFFDDAKGNTNANFYDVLGRRFYMGVNMNF